MVRKSKSPKPSTSPGKLINKKQNQSFQKSPGGEAFVQSSVTENNSINGKMKSSKENTSPRHTPQKGKKTPQHTPQKGMKTPQNTPQKEKQTPGKTPQKMKQTPGKTPQKMNQTPGKTPLKKNQTPGKTPQKMKQTPGKTPENKVKMTTPQQMASSEKSAKLNIKKKVDMDDEDPDDIGEEELMRLLNESDDDDDDFELDEDSEEEDEDASSSEGDKASKTSSAKSKAIVRKIKDEESVESEDDGIEDQGNLFKFKNQDDDDDDDDDDSADDAEIEAMLKNIKDSSKKQMGNQKNALAVEAGKHEESDEEADDDESMDEEEIKTLLKDMMKTDEGAAGAMKGIMEDEESDEDDDEEEVEDAEIDAMLKMMRQEAEKSGKQTSKKRLAVDEEEEDDDDDEEDDDDDDDEEEEEEDLLKAMKANLLKSQKKRITPDDDDDGEVPAKKQRAQLQDVSEDEDDDEDEDEEDDEDDDDAEIEALLQKMKGQPSKKELNTKSQKKRAAPDDDEEPEVAKKQRTLPVLHNDVEDSEEEVYKDTKEDEQKAALSKRYLQPTPEVVDPKLRKELETKIVRRMEATLRIHPVPPIVSSKEIEELCPEAVAIRIPWNKMTNRSKKAAFVQFADKQTADKWAEKLGASKFMNKQLTVDREPALGSDGIKAFNCRRIAVSNLPSNIEKTHLWKHFSRADYLDILANNPNNKRAPGVAFVTFKTDRDALEAFDTVNGTRIKGKRVSITFQRKPYDFDHRDHLTLVIFGVRKTISEADLAAVFARAKDVVIKAKGMAVATYEKSEACMADYKERQNVRMSGRPLVVTFGSRKALNTKRIGENAKPEPEPALKAEDKALLDRKAIFVKSLHQKTKVIDLQAVFPAAIDIELPTKGKVCKGYGFVKFATEAAAAAALAKVSSLKLHDRKIQAMYNKPGSYIGPRVDPKNDAQKVKQDPSGEKKGKKRMPQAQTTEKSSSGENEAQFERKKKPQALTGDKSSGENKAKFEGKKKKPKGQTIDKSSSGENKTQFEGKKNKIQAQKEDKKFASGDNNAQIEGKKKKRKFTQAERNKFKKSKMNTPQPMEVDDAEFTPKKPPSSQKFGGTSPGKRKFSGESGSSPEKKQKFDSHQMKPKFDGFKKNQKGKKNKFKKSA